MGDRVLPEQRARRRPKSNHLLGDHPALERDLRVAAKAGLTAEAFYDLPELEQRLQLALYEKDSRIHHDCGMDIAVCGNPDSKFYPQRQVCHAEMERAAAEWRYGELHEEAKFHDGSFKSWRSERSMSHPYHFNDGVRIIVAERDLYPDDDFLDSTSSDSPL